MSQVEKRGPAAIPKLDFAKVQPIVPDKPPLDQTKQQTSSSPDNTSTNTSPTSTNSFFGASSITPFEFWLNFTVELLSNLSPLVRVVGLDTEENNNTNSAVSSTIVNFARAIWWIYLVARVRGKRVHHDILMFDNLLARSLIFSIAYVGFLKSKYDSNWIPVIGCSDFFLTICFAGHMRTVLRTYPFTNLTLRIYRFLRLHAPMMWLSVGAYYLYITPTGYAKTLFVFYLLCGIHYNHDIFVRTTLIKASAPSSSPSTTSSSTSSSTSASTSTATMSSATTTSSSSTSSSSTTSPPAERPGLLLWQFIVIVLAELLSSSSPWLRLFGQESTAGNDDDNSSSFIITCAAGWIRIAFFLGTNIYISGRQFLNHIFVFDNLMSRQCLVNIGYIGFQASQYSSNPGWVLTSMITDILFVFTFMGHIRAMLTRYKFSTTSLRFYRLNRLYSLLVFVITGATIISAGKTNQYEPFLFYIATGISFAFDIYSKTTLIEPKLTVDRPALLSSPSLPNSPRVGSEYRPYSSTDISSIAAAAAAATLGSMSPRSPRNFSSFITNLFSTKTSNTLMTRARSPSTTVEYVAPRPKHINKYVFILAIVMEIIQSSMPIYRLHLSTVNNPQDESNPYETELRSGLAFAFTHLVRVIVWLIISYRLVGNWSFIRLYFISDSFVGQLCMMYPILCYVYAVTYDELGIIAFLLISEFISLWCFMGHIRTMLKHYHWTETTLKLYKLQRLSGPCIYSGVGVYYIYNIESSYKKNTVVFHFLMGILFFLDIYNRCANTKIPNPAKLASTISLSPLIKVQVDNGMNSPSMVSQPAHDSLPPLPALPTLASPQPVSTAPVQEEQSIWSIKTFVSPVTNVFGTLFSSDMTQAECGRHVGLAPNSQLSAIPDNEGLVTKVGSIDEINNTKQDNEHPESLTRSSWMAISSSVSGVTSSIFGPRSMSTTTSTRSQNQA